MTDICRRLRKLVGCGIGRRRKMDVLTQLPAKHRRTVVVAISPADATKLRELRAALEAADRANGGEQVGDNGAFRICSRV